LESCLSSCIAHHSSTSFRFREMSLRSAYRVPASCWVMAASAESPPADDIPGGLQYIDDPEALVPVEVLILPGEHGVDEVIGNLVYGNHFPLLFGEKLGNQAFIAIEDLGGQGRLDVLKALGVLYVLGRGYGEAHGHADDYSQQKTDTQQNDRHFQVLRRHGSNI
jgi:hypothetical protein